jgi:hypothetical protein
LTRRGGIGTTYKVALPFSKKKVKTTTKTTTATKITSTINDASAHASAIIGICIGQALQGGTTLSDFELDLDTLQIVGATQKYIIIIIIIIFFILFFFFPSCHSSYKKKSYYNPHSRGPGIAGDQS